MVGDEHERGELPSADAVEEAPHPRAVRRIEACARSTRQLEGNLEYRKFGAVFSRCEGEWKKDGALSPGRVVSFSREDPTARLARVLTAHSQHVRPDRARARGTAG